MATQIYCLQIASTGENLYTAETTFRISIWEKRACQKVLKDKRRKEEVKQAVKAGDVITAWLNYDEFKIGKTLKEITLECRRVFKE